MAIALVAAACSRSSPPSAIANHLVEEGLSAQQAGDVNKAFADYSQAVSEDPNNKYALYDLGYIYQQRGNTQNASTRYHRVLAIDPNFERAIYNLAVLEAPTDALGAISLYKRDLQLDPTNASLNFNLGVLLVKQGQAADGKAYLQKALLLNPALASDLPPGLTS